MSHWIQASPAPGHLSSQSQPKSSDWGLSWWLSTHLFEICSGKQDKFAVFTMINPTEFVRSSAVFNPAHTQLRTSSTRVLSDSDRNSLPCYLETDRHKEVNTTGGLALDFWHQKHEWAGKQRLLEMYGRDVSEVRKKKGWADIQGNSLGHWPLPWSLSDSWQDEGVQHTQEEFFLEQYNAVITGVCLHPREMYRDSGYPKRREICTSHGSSHSPTGLFMIPYCNVPCICVSLTYSGTKTCSGKEESAVLSYGGW